jgi:hypothetical protein
LLTWKQQQQGPQVGLALARMQQQQQWLMLWHLQQGCRHPLQQQQQRHSSSSTACMSILLLQQQQQQQQVERMQRLRP